MNGLKQGELGGFIGFSGGERGFDSFASCSFGGTGDYVASETFGGTFRETIFLVEGYLLFVFHSFGFSWLIVIWCIDLLLHPLPSLPVGLFVRLPFFPFSSGYAI
jgi:hypothetical protein